MSHLKYYSYKGEGAKMLKMFHFNEAVRIGDQIQCAGQGGGDPKTGEHPSDVLKQIEQAFLNIELNLKDTGGKGWSQVFSVKSYHVVLDNDVLGKMAELFKKYMPDHAPIWTCIGVPKLAQPVMLVEIDVVAHDPEGAKQAGSH